MKIKFKEGTKGYYVTADGQLYGQVDRVDGGFILTQPTWVVTEIRDRKIRLDGPSLKDVSFKTRREAAEALVKVQS